MLLILLSWIYIISTCLNVGVMINKALKVNAKDFAVTVILGLYGITLITSFWAFFYRVNWEFHVVLLLLNITVFISINKSIITCYKEFHNNLKSLPSTLKILLSTIAILILAKCSSLPYIIDNETYYLQSIKWLNDYGFVKGLANLHPFLTQMSGWHVVQSAFNFSFLNIPFNDLSGFCLLIGNIFAFIKFNAYFKNRKQVYLAVGLLPMVNIFLFQFISAPSPDLPVYIFTLILVFYFIENFVEASSGTFKILALLAVFSFNIKPTSVTLLVFPLVYLIVHFSRLKKTLPLVSIIGLATFSAFIAKNSIISGYPLFPYTGFKFNADYVLPKVMADFYIDMTRRYAFHLDSAEFASISLWKLFMHWLSLPGLHGLFNKIAIAIVLFSPFFIYKYYNKKALWIVYYIMSLQLVVLYISSPQYRFFFNFILVFVLLFTALVFRKRGHVNMLLYLTTTVTGILMFVPFNQGFFTKNKLMDANRTFSASTVVFPAPNSQMTTSYQSYHQNNLLYYSPEKTNNFWITGNAPLPALSQEQLNYFKKKCGYIPQLRGNTLADGFYSKPVAK